MDQLIFILLCYALCGGLIIATDKLPGLLERRAQRKFNRAEQKRRLRHIKHMIL